MKKLLLYTLLIAFNYTLSQAPNIEWQRVFGTNESEGINDLIQTSDGGYLIGETSGNSATQDKTEPSIGGFDYWLLKLDANGNNEWDETIGGTGNDQIHQILETNDGNYILAGRSSSDISGDKTENAIGSFDLWVIKIDDNGNIIWQNTIGGAGFESMESIEETTDGGFIVGAESSSGISGDKTEDNIGSTDIWVLKLDANGNIEWQNSIGGTELDILGAVKQTPDGGYFVAATSDSPVSGDKTQPHLGDRDYWVVRLDSNGNVLWDRTIGGPGRERMRDVVVTSTGDYIVVGESTSNSTSDKSEDNIGERDYWIVKLSADGNTILWDNTIGGSSSDWIDGIFPIASGGYMLVGNSSSGISGDKTQPNISGADMWIVKINDSGTIAWEKTVGSEGDNDEPTVGKPTADGGFILGAPARNTIFGDKTVPGYPGLFDGWIVKLESENLSTDDNALTGVSLYPNPSENHITINLGQNFKAVSIAISDITGRTVLKTNYSNISKINQELNMPSGLYLLKMTNNLGQLKTFKIVKK